MKRTCMLMAVVAFCGARLVLAANDVYLETFDDHGQYPDIMLLMTAQNPWWYSAVSDRTPPSNDPRAEWNNGVAGTTGTSAASKNYHWRRYSFDWKDPTVAGVIVGLDFKTPLLSNTYFPFRNDEVGWTINSSSEDTSDYFAVRLNKADPVTNPPTGTGTITGAWSNSSGSGGSGSKLVTTFAGSDIKELTFYRLRAQFTKLTLMSAKIDVTLTELNPDGSLGNQVASGSMADTSLLPSTEQPNPVLFTATSFCPTFRNYNGSAKGQADNAYLEVMRVPPPDCASKVTPDENTINYAEADINTASSPSSFDYAVQNIGTNSFTYTVTELNDQQQPADVGWLSTNKSGGTVANGASDTVTASINTTGLVGGFYTAYLKFTDSCSPAVSWVRRIDLAVYGCRWTLDSCSRERSYSLDYPTVLPSDVVYRLTNTAHPLNYSVAKTGDSGCFEWLIVKDKDGNPLTTGTIPVGQYADVFAHIDVNAMVGHDTDNDYTCTLTFTDTCSPQVLTRDVRLRYLGVGDIKTFAYKGDMDPEAENSAGTGYNFKLYETVVNGAVEEDPDAIDGKVWRMVDSSGGIKSRYRAQYWNGTDWTSTGLHGEGGTTMVARLKVNSWSDPDGDRHCWFEIADGDTSSAQFHWGGADGVAEEMKRDIGEQTGLGTSGFVTLWLATNGDQDTPEFQCGRNVDMYMLNDDGEIIWQKHITAASAKSSTRTGFFFGDDDTTAQMDVSYDWITGTNAGAFAPGEEVAVLGHSLLLQSEACVIPFPDADADGDVDMDDFAVLQLCYSPLVQVSDDCRCFDRDRNHYVNGDDVDDFVACAGGAGVPFDKQNPPAGCAP